MTEFGSENVVFLAAESSNVLTGTFIIIIIAIIDGVYDNY